MNTATMKAPEAAETHDFDPVINHRVAQHQILESIVTGKPVTALCGHRYVVEAQGEGSTAAPTNGVIVTCPMCETVLAEMHATC